MEGEATPETKVESTSENTQEKPNNFNRGERRGGGQRGGRFGRGGQNHGGNQHFENRRGRGNYGNINRNIKDENNGNENRQEGEGGNRPGRDREGRDDQRGDMGGRGGRMGGRMGRGAEDKFMERIQQMAGPSFDVPPVDLTERKFSGRNRLYIGNIGSEVTEEDINELFKPYGETAEVFINKDKNFGFIKVDYHANAEKAKRELDGTVLKSRSLKIRYAPNNATVKVKNLTGYVTNELLHYAFSIFGEIEKATVRVDERGKPTGEAIVDFVRKGSALHAIRKCTDGCFFLTGSVRPCIVEAYEVVNDNDGFSEKNINKKHPGFMKEREIGPRFGVGGSFENDYGMRWKQLYDLHDQKVDQVKKDLELGIAKLEAKMEFERYEHETDMLRDQLAARELDKERQKREWEMKQRQVEEERMRSEEQMKRTTADMEARIMAQHDDLRRRQQENNLFVQAHNLDSMLDQQEQAYDSNAGYSHHGGEGQEETNMMDPKSFMSSYERGTSRFDRGNAREPQGARGGHWVNDSRRGGGGDDFPNKRRRF
ncbi:protein no-on-transient A-like isoform X1 [Diabrotica undecimpunctata]|uniref:protein no-on-transient A-like isoform X1 n=1 Tax=Diabrotica undecimpunctata TaxID=50387 RepID=UPI003B63D04B